MTDDNAKPSKKNTKIFIILFVFFFLHFNCIANIKRLKQSFPILIAVNSASIKQIGLGVPTTFFFTITIIKNEKRGKYNMVLPKKKQIIVYPNVCNKGKFFFTFRRYLSIKFWPAFCCNPAAGCLAAYLVHGVFVCATFVLHTVHMYLYMAFRVNVNRRMNVSRRRRIYETRADESSCEVWKMLPPTHTPTLVCDVYLANHPIILSVRFKKGTHD